MDRRKAIKNLSLAFGITIATPTLITILNSCKEGELDWKPVFLSRNQVIVIDYLTDIIIPKTEIAGGLDLNITQFMDKMLLETETKQNQIIFNRGSEEFINSFRKILNKDVYEGNKDEFKKILNNYFLKSENEQKKLFELIAMDFDTISDEEKPNYLIYKFLTTVRYYSLFGFYTSETIMQDVLHYNPVPGYYKGCVDY